jgi:hypothetical protein
MRAEPWLNKSGLAAAIVSPDDRARLRPRLAGLDLTPHEPRELASIEQLPAGFQAGKKVELPLRQHAHHEPDPPAGRP